VTCVSVPSRVLAIAVAIGEPPAAAPVRFELEWEAPVACPGGADARARVERFLGRAVGRAGDPEVHARVRISEREGLFVAAVSLQSADGSGERELVAERCDVVTDATAYVVAALIDPTVEPPAPEPDPPPDPIPPVAVPLVVAPPPKPSPPRPPPKRPGIRGAIRVGAGVGVGPLPSVAPGVIGGAALTWRRLRVQLDVAHWFARPARLENRPDVGGDIRLTTGGARICVLAVMRPIELPLCGAVELGSMRGRGVGLEQTASTRLLWAALTASAGFIWMPSPWIGVWADAVLVVPVSRPVFEAENVGRIHQPAPAAFAGMLGVEARFP
jgi:hypothetical protein